MEVVYVVTPVAMTVNVESEGESMSVLVVLIVNDVTALLLLGYDHPS